MFVKIGFFIFSLGLALPAFTSSFPLSKKEKYLAASYRFQKNNSVEAKHSYMHVIILKIAKGLMLIGLLMVLVGYYFIN